MNEDTNTKLRPSTSRPRPTRTVPITPYFHVCDPTQERTLVVKSFGHSYRYMTEPPTKVQNFGGKIMLATRISAGEYATESYSCPKEAAKELIRRVQDTLDKRA